MADGGLDLVERHRGARGDEIPEPAQGHRLSILLVDETCERLVAFGVLGAHRLLQRRHRLRIPDVALAAGAVVHVPPDVEARARRAVRTRARGASAPLPRSRASPTPRMRDAVPVKYFVDDDLIDADRLEDLRALVRRQRADAHLGHDLEQPLFEGLDVFGGRLSGCRIAGQHLVAAEASDDLEGEVRIHGAGAESDEQRQVADLARLARFDDDAGAHARPLADEVVMHGAGREQARDRRVTLVDVAVARG